jgi:hypothetical protein
MLLACCWWSVGKQKSKQSIGGVVAKVIIGVLIVKMREYFPTCVLGIVGGYIDTDGFQHILRQMLGGDDVKMLGIVIEMGVRLMRRDIHNSGADIDWAASAMNPNIYAGRTDMVRCLVELGTKVARNELNCAIMHGHTDTARYLEQLGIVPNTTYESVIAAAKRNDINYIRVLCELGYIDLGMPGITHNRYRDDICAAAPANSEVASYSKGGQVPT